MNKRIKELLRQSYIDYEQPIYRNSYDSTVTSVQTTRVFDPEKFAELIIRECALAIDNVYANAKPDHGCYDWATFAESSDILDHFEMK